MLLPNVLLPPCLSFGLPVCPACLPGLSSPFSLARSRIHLCTHLKEELTNLFSKLTGFFQFPHRQGRQECEHFAYG